MFIYDACLRKAAVIQRVDGNEVLYEAKLDTTDVGFCRFDNNE